MLMPSIFGEDLFDNFMKDFPFFDQGIPGEWLYDHQCSQGT